MQLRLDAFRLERSRQWGACCLADQRWRTLHLDDFFGARLPVSRKYTDWEKVLRVLVIYRLLAPGSEWRLHLHWFSTTALPDLLGSTPPPRRMTLFTVVTTCSNSAARRKKPAAARRASCRSRSRPTARSYRLDREKLRDVRGR